MKTKARILLLVTLLATSAPGPAEATFPGRNGRVAFVGFRVDTSEGCSYTGTADIYLMDGDGKNIRNLTENAASESHPAWSPDDKYLAYGMREAGGDDQYSGLEVHGFDGGGSSNIAISENDIHPSWSDHGFWIAYGYAMGEDYDIRRITPDGEREEVVTATRFIEEMPAYAPDGERIAYVTDRGQDGDDIWTIRPDGTRARRITESVTSGGPGAAYGGISSLGWSPDGRWILFSMNRGEGKTFIYKIRRNGRSMKRLAQGRDPVWSPNGRTILYQTLSGENGTYKGCTEELFKMDATGADKHELRKDDTMQMYSFDWGSR